MHRGKRGERFASATAGSTRADLLAVVQDVAERLAASDTVEEVAAAVSTVVRDAVGATACTVTEISAGCNAAVTLAATGLSPRTIQLISSPVPLTADSPASRAIATGEPIVWQSLADRDRDYPQFAGWPSEHEAWTIYPLVARNNLLGIVAFGWTEARRFHADELAFVQAVAHQCALAFDRARLLESERRERTTLTLLAEGTRLMISALHPQEVVERLVAIAVPAMADWCAVYTEQAGGLRVVAVAARGLDDPRALLAEIEPVPLTGDSEVARCFRTRDTVVVEDVPPAATARVSGLAADMLRRAPIRSGVAVPIVASDEPIGVLILAFSQVRRYSDDLRFAAEGLAARAGIALSNARRFQHERHTAAVLTEALLPRREPTIEGYDVAARYLPAGDPVAGDWYDVLALTNRFLLGVGDVGGHGIDAASAMAEFRNAARGIAIGGGGPGDVIAGLARLATLPDIPDLFATAIYGTLEPPTGAFEWSAAGHLPPLVFGPESVLLEYRVQSPALGSSLLYPPAVHRVTIEPDGGIVLITDGVVERRRGRSIDDALADLATAVGANRHLAASALADMIVGSFCEEREDDCCILVVRRDGAGE